MTAINVLDMSASEGYVRVTWTPSTNPNFYSWRVYLKQFPDEPFRVVDEIFSAPTASYNFYGFTSGPQDLAVTEVVQNPVTGALTEDSQEPRTVHPQAERGYFLIHPTKPHLSMQLRTVVAEEFGDEQERQAIPLIGRGRKINLGTNYGQQGVLSIQLRDDPNLGTAREQRLKLKELIAEEVALQLRTPFGDVIRVGIVNSNFTRVAAGPMEAVDFSLQYEEVF